MTGSVDKGFARETWDSGNGSLLVALRCLCCLSFLFRRGDNKKWFAVIMSCDGERAASGRYGIRFFVICSGGLAFANLSDWGVLLFPYLIKEYWGIGIILGEEGGGVGEYKTILFVPVKCHFFLAS